MAGPDPRVARCRVAVRSALADLPRGALVLVACSGGPDSLALAATTAFVAPRAGLRAGAVVVDHDLQAGSADVAERAARQCRALGLDPVEVRRVAVGRGPGPEAAAREARYAALTEVAEASGAAAVLLGHTRDDQAETVLLGLARGSGARSLAGMPARRGVLRRPLLDVPRDVTAAVCAVLGLEPWQDPTNDPASATDGRTPPLRSRVRHEVLPVLEAALGPGVAAALARTAEQLAEDAEVLDALAADLARAAVADDGAADEGWDAAVLAAAPTAVRRRALRRLLTRAGVPAGSLHRSHVLAVDALVVDWRGQGPVDVPGGRRIVRTCGRLAVAPRDDHGPGAGT